MKDKLGRRAKVNDRVAVASLRLDGNLHTNPCLNIGTVTYMTFDSVTVSFDNTGYTDDITSNEFVIISSSGSPVLINDAEYEVGRDIKAFVSSFGMT